MWEKAYKDYPIDTHLKKCQVESGKGITGCEMHEQMGWGISHDLPKHKKKIGPLRALLYSLFGGPKEE